jgi:CDP-paratose 2-epimerase
VHAAAQPSHDWAARDPKLDFAVNATSTLNLLEATRRHAPNALFLFMSSNKVYGDKPNELPLLKTATRFVIDPSHPFAAHGIDETMQIDQSRHSLFGVSKTAADLMVQEYALRFGLRTYVFRAGCITGVDQRAVEAHGFLAYLCRQVTSGGTYQLIGYGGLQVRDNLDASDLAAAFAMLVREPGEPSVFNIGGGPQATVSVLEALELAGRISGRTPRIDLVERARYGDHKYWVSDIRRFQAAYPSWRPSYQTADLVERLVAGR